jgi:hypothetical protein
MIISSPTLGIRTQIDMLEVCKTSCYRAIPYHLYWFGLAMLQSTASGVRIRTSAMFPGGLQNPTIVVSGCNFCSQIGLWALRFFSEASVFERLASPKKPNLKELQPPPPPFHHPWLQYVFSYQNNIFPKYCDTSEAFWRNLTAYQLSPVTGKQKTPAWKAFS